MPDKDQAPSIFPTLRYRDATAALGWLNEAFGFQKSFAIPGPDGTTAHAEISLGHGVVMLGSAPAGSELEHSADWRTAPQSIYVAVDDVDAHYERARSAGEPVESSTPRWGLGCSRRGVLADYRPR